MENRVGLLSFTTRLILHIVDAVAGLIRHGLGW